MQLHGVRDTPTGCESRTQVVRHQSTGYEASIVSRTQLVRQSRTQAVRHLSIVSAHVVRTPVVKSIDQRGTAGGRGGGEDAIHQQVVSHVHSS